jgi:hypothetical protein
MVSSVEDDLTPGRWNFTRTRGDIMRATSFAVVIDGSPAVTDPIAQVRVARSRTSQLVLDLEATVDGANIVVGEDIALDVDPGVYWWDLAVDDLTVVGGTFQVLDDVSEVEGS